MGAYLFCNRWGCVYHIGGAVLPSGSACRHAPAPAAIPDYVVSRLAHELYGGSNWMTSSCIHPLGLTAIAGPLHTTVRTAAELFTCRFQLAHICMQYLCNASKLHPCLYTMAMFVLSI